MAEWWMEGFLERLLDASDSVANNLREKAQFYIVPNMNPDGSRLGHHRTNAVGVDLNRAWAQPSLDRSPEVYLVRKRILETKPSFCLDVHGAEDLSHVFVVGPEGPSGYKEPIAGLITEYKKELLLANDDFQTQEGFVIPNPEDAEISIGTNYLGEVLNCLCLTLEMPFKDTAKTPNDQYGWSPQRSKKLGRDNLTAMLAMADLLGKFSTT